MIAGSRTIGSIPFYTVPIAQVLLRDVERRPIWAQALPPVADGVARVQIQAVNRHAISAITHPLPIIRGFGFDSAGSGFDQSPFRPSVALDAAIGLVEVQQRVADRHVIWAESVSPGSVSLSEIILIERHEVWALAAFAPPAVGIAPLNVRSTPRHPVTAQALSPPSNALGNTQTLAAPILGIAALSLSLHSTGMALVLVRATQRHPIWPQALSPPPTGTVQVQKRTAMEKAVAALSVSQVFNGYCRSPSARISASPDMATSDITPSHRSGASPEAHRRRKGSSCLRVIARYADWHNGSPQTVVPQNARL